MVYLHIDKNSIKLLSLTKTILGQYNISFFEKHHETNLIEKGKVKNIDVLASAIKEAYNQAYPNPVNDKDVVLILPAESFDFARYTVPSDISQSAVIPFVKDKIRADVSFNLDESFFDYIISKQEKESTVLLFAQKYSVTNDFKQICALLQLNITNIIPDCLCYYTLFEKTLRKDKKESILYVFLDEQISFAYLFDYLGPIHCKRYEFENDKQTALKKLVDKIQGDGIKLHRLILSGEKSKKIRQDLFTKDMGVWTNPLEKIITTFYQQYVKQIIPDKSEKFSLLNFDICLGAFIFSQTSPSFSVIKKTFVGFSSKKISLPALPSISIKLPFSKKVFIFFIISLVVSLGIILGAKQFITNIKIPSVKKVTPTPTIKPVKPSPKPSPTPSITREDINIKILNGNGVRGQAGELRSSLLEKGYAEVLVDNAKDADGNLNFDVEKTQIEIKNSKKEALQLINEDLASYITVKKSIPLDEAETADIILTIGADFK